MRDISNPEIDRNEKPQNVTDSFDKQQFAHSANHARDYGFVPKTGRIRNENSNNFMDNTSYGTSEKHRFYA